jgi:hypothetical protein
MMKILIAFSVSIFIIFVADLPTGECARSRPHVTIVQPCTYLEIYDDNYPLKIRPCSQPGYYLVCCWEIISYNCDGSIYREPDLYGACCVPPWYEGDHCENRCSLTEQNIAANYPQYYDYDRCEPDDCCKEEEASCCPPGKPKCPDDRVGNPIRVLSGNNEEVEIDLEFSSSNDKGFKIYRTYKSRSNISTTMGYGWTHNYNVILSLSDPSRTDHFRIIDESGRYHLYRDTSSNGIYTGYMSTTGTLVREAGGTYTWHRANDTTYTFNQDLKFTSKTDGKGNVQSLSYNAEGFLETVTDQSTSRSIGFVYNDEGRIAHITGPMTAAVPSGIWITYQYDAVGNLTRVIYADDDNGSGASGFEYQYSDPRDPHNLTEKRNLAGEFISSWKYDSFDRAYESISRDGKGVAISGYGTSSGAVTDAQGVQKTYTIETFKGRKTITHISGADGCASCGGDAVRYGYDDQRRVNEIEYANGRIDRYTDFDTRRPRSLPNRNPGRGHRPAAHDPLHLSSGNRRKTEHHRSLHPRTGPQGDDLRL